MWRTLLRGRHYSAWRGRGGMGLVLGDAGRCLFLIFIGSGVIWLGLASAEGVTGLGRVSGMPGWGWGSGPGILGRLLGDMCVEDFAEGNALLCLER